MRLHLDPNAAGGGPSTAREELTTLVKTALSPTAIVRHRRGRKVRHGLHERAGRRLKTSGLPETGCSATGLFGGGPFLFGPLEGRLFGPLGPLLVLQRLPLPPLRGLLLLPVLLELDGSAVSLFQAREWPWRALSGKNENSGTGGSLSSWGEARPKKDGYWNPAECGKTCALVSFYNVSRGDEMFRKGSTAGATSDVEDREIFEIYHGIERCWSVGHPRGWYIAEWGLPQMEGGFKRNGPLHERGGWLKVPGSPFVLTLHFARKLGLRESPP